MAKLEIDYRVVEVPPSWFYSKIMPRKAILAALGVSKNIIVTGEPIRVRWSEWDRGVHIIVTCILTEQDATRRCRRTIRATSKEEKRTDLPVLYVDKRVIMKLRKLGQ